ncbi:hypothetical protein HFO56_24960 [Rhizobium laguerreae]|uniref:hypothetical protein n=1 Tax=Rhizobium laguerreae TaxID=1076926 RepID=UPI001C91E83E|nr:hypothetical protein [Rhizobium laguerreae]MBY3155581.1 hypothetical protein [Rhizobium laguerreae]MBY3433754.1 hypothetical protein [Rhizobium laguerreae]
MTRQLNPEVNYSTILFEGMAKWRPNHLVESYAFDVFSGFTRLSLRFRDELLERTPLQVGSKDVVFDYDHTRLSVTWTGRDGRGWRFAMSPETAGGVGIDKMIGFMNYPLGALATITQEHMSLATRCPGPMPADMARAPFVRMDWSHLEAVGRHRDVSAFMYTKTEQGMSLDVKLTEASSLPVRLDDTGARMMSFGITPERFSLAWGAGKGRAEERSWIIEDLGRSTFESDILSDLIGFAYRVVTGEREADVRGKAANPVWRLVNLIESTGVGKRGMLQAHG